MARIEDLFPEDPPQTHRVTYTGDGTKEQSISLPPGAGLPLIVRPVPDVTVQDVLATLPFGYLSGAAGTGKTFLAREIIAARDDAALTASTGIAAVNLGDASTINALLRYFDTASLINSYTSGMLQAQLRKLRRSGIRLIVLDETSMVSGDQLTVIVRAIDEVNHTTQYDADLGDYAGDRDVPEMSLLLVGDFAQLPAIKAPFAFESPEWPRFRDHTVKLTTVRRQGDQAFIAALHAIRRGRAAEAVDVFAPCFVSTVDHHFEGTTLLARNEAVDRLNHLRHDTLTGALLCFPTIRSGEQLKDWQKLIPESTNVKTGARVMVLANRRNSPDEDDLTFAYVNGDLGTVESKSGGGCRVRLDRTGATMTIVPVTREWKEPTGKKLQPFHVRGTVTYLPVRLCYASTVHKSQGLSLDSVQVGLADHFFGSPSMLYVALSRCRSLAGLRIVGNRKMFVSRCSIDPKIRGYL